MLSLPFRRELSTRLSKLREFGQTHKPSPRDCNCIRSCKVRELSLEADPVLVVDAVSKRESNASCDDVVLFELLALLTFRLGDGDLATGGPAELGRS